MTISSFHMSVLLLAAVAFIGGTLFVLQQFAGINGVLYYSSLTFQSVGISRGALASLYVGFTNFAGVWSDVDVYIYMLKYAFYLVLIILISYWMSAGALCASYLMDKQGRQTLLIASYLGMVSALLKIFYDRKISINICSHL